jgi:hypothetical protein
MFLRGADAARSSGDRLEFGGQRARFGACSETPCCGRSRLPTSPASQLLKDVRAILEQR